VHSTNYVVGFILILTATVAVGLTTIRELTKGTAEKNEAVFNKRQILKAVNTLLVKKEEDMTDDEVEALFSSDIKQVAVNIKGEPVDANAIVSAGYKGGTAVDIDMAKEKKKDDANRIFPLFIYKGGKAHVVSVRGKGLWDEIWGNIAIDLSTNKLIGASFDHKGETPGLGAEIKDNASWAAQFAGKSLYNDAGEYTSVYVRKGGAKDKTYEVDGISGATVTCDGVSKMLNKGIKYYQPYFDTVK